MQAERLDGSFGREVGIVVVVVVVVCFRTAGANL